jgi:hypothetical protein
MSIKTYDFDFYYNLGVKDSQGVPMMPRDLVIVTDPQTGKSYYNAILEVTSSKLRLDSLSSMQGGNLVGNTYEIILNPSKYTYEIVQGNYGGVNLEQRKSINAITDAETTLLVFAMNILLDNENPLWDQEDLCTDENIFGTSVKIDQKDAFKLAEKIKKIFNLPEEAIDRLNQLGAAFTDRIYNCEDTKE